MNVRINSKKSVIKNQHYEKYWRITLGTSKWNSEQFIRTLQLILKHIDKYELSNKPKSSLILNYNQNKKKLLNPDTVHQKELFNLVSQIYTNDDKTGASTRKQLNQYIKLGFVKPFYQGYPQQSKDYIEAKSDEERMRLFSDIVYSYSTFNSSQTNDDTQNNQIKFLVNTLLNKKDKTLTHEEIIALMNIDITKKKYAKQKEINSNLHWSKVNGFEERKYNQISFLKDIIKSMNFFYVIDKPFSVHLTRDSDEFLLPEVGSTVRDNYRFGVMKKAVYDESIKVYGKKVSWLSKKESAAYVVSHIRDSADALRKWDLDAAYDPNNSLLLAQGNEDQYFDKKKITFNQNGKPVLGKNIVPDFISEVENCNYSIDEDILNDKRKSYLLWHNKQFYLKNK